MVKDKAEIKTIHKTSQFINSSDNSQMNKCQIHKHSFLTGKVAKGMPTIAASMTTTAENYFSISVTDQPLPSSEVEEPLLEVILMEHFGEQNSSQITEERLPDRNESLLVSLVLLFEISQ